MTTGKTGLGPQDGTLAAASMRVSCESSGYLDFTNGKLEKIIVIALFVLAIGCYAGSLTNGFVYDDDQQILLNPYIKSWHFLPEIFTTTVWSFVGSAGSSNYYRPLMTMTYLALWQCFGDLPFGYHLFNIVLNGLVVIAVYFAGRAVLREAGAAAIAAFLFAMHPIHTETVSWIAAVPDLEATLLILVAFILYMRIKGALEAGQVGVVGCFLLAMLAKEPALMLVPLLVLYEHLARADRKETSTLTKMRRYFPICVAGAAYLLCRVVLLGKFAPVLQHGQISWVQAIYSGFALVAEYTKLLVWPEPLSAFHTFHVSNSLMEGRVLAGMAIVAGSLAFIAAGRKRYSAEVFSLLWIGFTIAPVLNSRWMASNVLAERYLYLPSAGFCWIVGSMVQRGWNAASSEAKTFPAGRIAMAAAVVVVGIAGTIKTVARTRDWRDNTTLYQRTLQTDPDSYVMHLNLGTSYFQSRNYSGAEAELKQALSMKPDSVNVMNALGCLYLEKGRTEESAEMFQKAIELKSTWTDPHYNYGRLLSKTGHRDEALMEFRKAVETGPLNASARLYLGQLLEQNGDVQGAEAEYRKSIELSGSFEAEHGLIGILLGSGRGEEAEGRMESLLKKYPFDGEMHLKLARQLEAKGNNARALREYRAAEELDSKNPEIQAAIKRLASKN